MWSPTKLDFLFYEFSVIYYDFYKDSNEINKKEKDKTVVTVAKPPSKTARRGDLAGFAKFRGKLDHFIIYGVK
jgi:hypothetical protein